MQERIDMVVLKVVYTHSGDPVYEGSRRKTVKEMEDFITDLVYDVRFAGISCSFESVEGDRNDVTINGKTVSEIIAELGTDIRRPNLDELGRPKTTTRIGRESNDWHDGCIEDISPILMKNAFSKAYADTRKSD